MYSSQCTKILSPAVVGVNYDIVILFYSICSCLLFKGGSGIIDLRGDRSKETGNCNHLAILLVESVLLGLSDMDISVADTSIPYSKITTGQTKVSNLCAIAMIIIDWTNLSGEGGSNEF